MGIWDEVKELVTQGKSGFSINLTPGQEVKVGGKIGRPKTRDPQRPFAHFADPRARKSNGKSRPRCIRLNCFKQLKVNDVAVCSDECAELVRVEITERMKLLTYREEKRNEDGKKRASSSTAHERGTRRRGVEARKGAEVTRGRKAKSRTRKRKRLTQSEQREILRRGGRSKVEASGPVGASNSANPEVRNEYSNIQTQVKP